MVRARYVGEAEGDVEAFGATFKEGKWASVAPQYLTKLLGNPHFEVEGAKNGTGGGTQEPTAPLKAVHRGRGAYAIMRGDDEVKDGLTKEDADAFNALSDADKAEYVK